MPKSYWREKGKRHKRQINAYFLMYLRLYSSLGWIDDILVHGHEATTIPVTGFRQSRAGNDTFFPKVVEMGKQGIETFRGHNVKSNKRMDNPKKSS